MACGRPALPALRETLMDRRDQRASTRINAHQRASTRQGASAASMSVDSLAGASWGA